MDIRHVIRLLLKDRAFTLTTVLTLAVCVGATAAILAVVNSVLVRPLPVADAQNLVLVYNSYPKAGVARSSAGVPDYYDRLRETDVFEELTLYNTRGMTIGGEGSAQRLTGIVGRPSFLRMLGVQPVRGRIFSEEEGEVGKTRKAILGYSLWQQQFGGREDAVGGDLRINGVPHQIVGVMPEGFRFAPDVELFVPLAFSPEERADGRRHSNNWTMIGRLKGTASVQQAQQQIDALNARNLERFANMKEVLLNAGFTTVVTPLQEDMVREIRRTLLLLLGGVLVLLAIGTVNITNLALIRSSGRMRELATRHALGAGIGRLTRLLLTETVLLTAVGGAAGAVAGYWALELLRSALDVLPRGDEIRMDAITVAATMGVALLVGIVVGLVPVVSVRRMNLSQAFREEGRSGTTGRGARGVRRALVTSQVAFAFMLLAGAGVMVASFQRVLAVHPGFSPAGLLTARVTPPASRYPGDKELRAFTARLLEEVRKAPGVQSAGFTSNLPFGGSFNDSVILAEGYQMAAGESLISPFNVSVTPGYMETLQVPLVKGRFFSDGDTDQAPAVVIVDAKLANKFWPGKDPIGRRMFTPGAGPDPTKPAADSTWYTVVGVVGETRMGGLVGGEERVGAYYFPMMQSVARTVTLAVRTIGDPTNVVPGIRSALTSIDAELPLYSVRSMQDRIDESVVDRRTPMMLGLVFGGVALFLAALGLYGVLAYQVSQRRKEIGIRMALGSDPKGIFSLVLREGLMLLIAGFALGLAGAWTVRKAVETQLYEVSAMEPGVLAAVAGVLGVVAIVACLVPARRAARIDPLVALSE